MDKLEIQFYYEWTGRINYCKRIQCYKNSYNMNKMTIQYQQRTSGKLVEDGGGRMGGSQAQSGWQIGSPDAASCSCLDSSQTLHRGSTRGVVTLLQSFPPTPKMEYDSIRSYAVSTRGRQSVDGCVFQHMPGCDVQLTRVSSVALLLRLGRDEADVFLIQEPWLNRNRISGLRTKSHKLLAATNIDRTRARRCQAGKQ